MQGAYKQRVRAYNDMMTTAWWGARLTGAKKPPPLKDLLISETSTPRRRQSWQEIKASLMLALGPGNSTPRKK